MKFEEVDRIEIILIAKTCVRVDRLEIALGRNNRKCFEHDLTEFLTGDSSSGSCSKRSIAERNDPPRCPSLTR